MKYAPIIIPTLNRSTHLRRCVESLASNPWAKYTDLMISVDYPPSEKYRTGYEEVLSFVDSLEYNNKFNKVVVYKQSENLGPLGNEYFLLNELGKRGYDRYIFTEDDNDYSLNFIEFMDKALEFFENDEKVFAICSQSWLYIPIAGNFFYSPWFSAWGYACWLKRKIEIDKKVSRKYFNTILHSSGKQWRLFWECPAVYRIFASDLLGEVPAMRTDDGEVASIDFAHTICCISEKMHCVYPAKRMERNWGFDGSGDNCDVEAFNPGNTIIDLSDSFDKLIEADDVVRKSRINNRIFKKARNYPGRVRLFRSFLIINARRFLSDKKFNNLKRLIQKTHIYSSK